MKKGDEASPSIILAGRALLVKILILNAFGSKKNSLFFYFFFVFSFLIFISSFF